MSGPLTTTVCARVNDGEKAAITAMSRAAGMTVSDWTRRALGLPPGPRRPPPTTEAGGATGADPDSGAG